MTTDRGKPILQGQLGGLFQYLEAESHKTDWRGSKTCKAADGKQGDEDVNPMKARSTNTGNPIEGSAGTKKNDKSDDATQQSFLDGQLCRKMGTATNVISNMPLNLISYKYHKATNAIMQQTS